MRSQCSGSKQSWLESSKEMQAGAATSDEQENPQPWNSVVQVTVNNARNMNSGPVTSSVAGTVQPVFVTPLSRVPRYPSSPRDVAAAPDSQPSHDQRITAFDKILVKAVVKGAQKQGKVFTLRKVHPAKIVTCADLKLIIRQQLKEEIVANDFEVGFMSGTTVVQIRTTEDLSELWSDLRKTGSKVMLWCDGLRGKTVSRKRSCSTEKPEARPSKGKKEDNASRVEEIVEDLKCTHGSNFSPMQIRIWGEMIAAGMHCSTDNPPNTSMFLRAGGSSTTLKGKSTQQSSVLTEALTEAASAISSALSPKPGAAQGKGTSPSKVIDGRSKLYKQLSELQNLKTSGILTEDEYASEKESIMTLLQQINHI